MIDVRGGIVTLLQAAGLTPTVYSTRLDKLIASECPAVSVLNVSSNQEQIGNTPQFQVEFDIALIVLVAKTDNYDSLLDTHVTALLAALMTDIDWQQQFEQLPRFTIQYDYDPAGETNTARATILLTVRYVEEYVVTVPDDFTQVNLKADLAIPDLIIDAESDITL